MLNGEICQEGKEEGAFGGEKKAIQTRACKYSLGYIKTSGIRLYEKKSRMERTSLQFFLLPPSPPSSFVLFSHAPSNNLCPSFPFLPPSTTNFVLLHFWLSGHLSTDVNQVFLSQPHPLSASFRTTICPLPRPWQWTEREEEPRSPSSPFLLLSFRSGSPWTSTEWSRRGGRRGRDVVLGFFPSF